MFEQLKYDLRQIRFYYQRKKVFDEANSIIGENGTVGLAKKYNQAICNAMPQLYELCDHAAYLRTRLPMC